MVTPLASVQWASRLAAVEWPAFRKAYGKVIPLRGKQPALAENWRTLDPTDADVAAWSRAAFDIGVPGGEVVFVDVDLADPQDDELAGIIRATIEAQLGRTLRRWRANGANFALVYYQPDNPVRAKWTAEIRDAAGTLRGKVEILTFGQFLLLAGVHPSDVLFNHDGPEGIGPHTDCHALPKVDRADMDRAMEALHARLEAITLRLDVSRAGEDGAAAVAVCDPRHVASDMVRLKECVNSIPNETINDRGKWVAIMHAMKGACGGDGVFFEDVALPWCLRWKGAPAADVEAEARRVWESIRAVRHGADRLEAIARQYGWRGRPLRDDLVPQHNDDDDWLAPPETAGGQQTFASQNDDWLALPEQKPAGLSKGNSPKLSHRMMTEWFVLNKPDVVGENLYRSRNLEGLVYDRTSGCFRPKGKGARVSLRRQVADFIDGVIDTTMKADTHTANGVTDQVIGYLLVDDDDLDPDPAGRCCANGMVFLPTLTERTQAILDKMEGVQVLDNGVVLAPHSPLFRCTRSTRLTITGDGHKPTFALLRLAMEWSDGDKDKARYLLRIFARLMLYDPAGAYCIALLGETNTGKSSCERLVKRLLGDFAGDAKINLLFSSTEESANHHGGNWTSQVHNKTAVFFNEGEKPRRKNADPPDASAMKALTDGEAVPARLPGTGVSIPVRMKNPVIVANSLPDFRYDAAAHRRLCPFLFRRKWQVSDDPVAKARLDARLTKAAAENFLWLMGLAAAFNGQLGPAPADETDEKSEIALARDPDRVRHACLRKTLHTMGAGTHSSVKIAEMARKLASEKGWPDVLTLGVRGLTMKMPGAFDGFATKAANPRKRKPEAWDYDGRALNDDDRRLCGDVEPGNNQTPDIFA